MAGEALTTTPEQSLPSSEMLPFLGEGSFPCCLLACSFPPVNLALIFSKFLRCRPLYQQKCMAYPFLGVTLGMPGPRPARGWFFTLAAWHDPTPWPGQEEASPSGESPSPGSLACPEHGCPLPPLRLHGGRAGATGKRRKVIKGLGLWCREERLSVLVGQTEKRL